MVTNSGTTTLSGVVANDGDIEATARNEDLEPGESATFLFSGIADADLINTVEVSATDPHGTEVTGSAQAELIVTPAPQAQDEAGEEPTGGSATGWIIGGILVVLAGAGLTYYLVKRRSADGGDNPDAEADESVEG